VSAPNEERGEDPGYGTRPAGEEPRVVVRDRRRLDPETGQVRPPVVDEQATTGAGGQAESAGRHAAAPEGAATAPAGAPDPVVDAGLTDGSQELRAQLDERTGDLQRLTAEYANYRKRVERDREAVLVSAKATLVGELLSVLDDVERAGSHGDLTGAFKSVADKLVTTLQRSGLAPFGQDGEPFDPSVHEAVQHDTSPDVPGPTVTAVLRRGYRLGDRVIRAALVAVTDHEAGGASVPGPDAEQPVTGETAGPDGTGEL
jgi:molecular chaperone GrpE